MPPLADFTEFLSGKACNIGDIEGDFMPGQRKTKGPGAAPCSQASTACTGGSVDRDSRRPSAKGPIGELAALQTTGDPQSSASTMGLLREYTSTFVGTSPDHRLSAAEVDLQYMQPILDSLEGHPTAARKGVDVLPAPSLDTRGTSYPVSAKPVSAVREAVSSGRSRARAIGCAESFSESSNGSGFSELGPISFGKHLQYISNSSLRTACYYYNRIILLYF